jgi:hypothetical protein
MQTGPALPVEPADPPVRALPGYPQLAGDVRDRPALGPDPPHQQAPAMKRQPGVSVGHEDLQWGEDAYLHRTRRSSYRSSITVGVSPT